MIGVYDLINGWASQFLKWLVGSAIILVMIEGAIIYYTIRNNRRVHQKLDEIIRLLK